VSAITWWEPGIEPLGPCVVAIGVFDGVHVGHQALVRDTVALAREQNVRSVVVTFDRDPDQVVSPATAMAQLLDLDDKLSLLASQGSDVVLVVPFTESLAATPPLVFLDRVLLETMTPVAVAVGRDFRFGHRAEGDVDVLIRYGAAHGFEVLAHELVRDAEGPVTSTRIRRLVESGDVAPAAPTANLVTAPFAALPAHGVYAGRVELDGAEYAAAVSVGRAPSFPEATAELEVHLIGFRGDLYGRNITVELLGYLRPQRPFATSAELAAAIRDDIETVRRMGSA
jgi:riboflavin kinase/FMN adenylyltransferase